MNNFVAIDFETANRSRNSACGIGLAVVQDGRIMDTFSSLILDWNREMLERLISEAQPEGIRSAQDRINRQPDALGITNNVESPRFPAQLIEGEVWSEEPINNWKDKAKEALTGIKWGDLASPMNKRDEEIVEDLTLGAFLDNVLR